MDTISYSDIRGCYRVVSVPLNSMNLDLFYYLFIYCHYYSYWNLSTIQYCN